MNDVLQRIKEKYAQFSKGQKLISDYILNNYEKAAYMTASKLGATVSVSESTVVRFATELGYDGYPMFQKMLLNLIRIKLTARQRMEVANERTQDEDVIETVLTSDIEQIKQTLYEIDDNTFFKVVNELISAKKIYILGVRSSNALATFMGFYFSLMFDNVKVLNSSSSTEIFEQVIRVGEDDVVIGISFPRYSKRTVQMLEYSKKQGAKTIALTDSNDSPLCEFSDFILTAKSDMVSFADSLVAPLSIINALITAIAHKKPDEIAKTLENLENMWEENQVYNKSIGEI